MTANTAVQMDLLGGPLSPGRQHGGALLGIVVDHRTWLRFLNEEWLLPSDVGITLLGIGRPVVAGSLAQLTPVGIWFDPNKLPKMELMALRNGAWASSMLDDVALPDAAIAWKGPLPLFAVDHFTFKTSEAKSHMMGMARQFADIEVPPQPAIVDEIGALELTTSVPQQLAGVQPPANWDALRGAAEMAMFAVPSIGPWLSLLCGFLNRGEAPEVCRTVDASWLASALWSNKFAISEDLPPLWRAMVRQLTRPGLLKEWQPQRILNDICSEARSYGYNDEELRASTSMLLEDRGTIQTIGLQDDILALTFQLLLLRPSPARFVSWKDDWPAIPPCAWWVGAMLSGYLSGFRALQLHFRGSPSARRLVALRTWQFGAKEKLPDEWSDLVQGKVSWTTDSDAVIIFTELERLLELKLSNRGRWNQLDFNVESNRDAAKKLAEQFCPELIRQSIVFQDGRFDLIGDGKATLDEAGKSLLVTGKLSVALGTQVNLQSQLDVGLFRHWLVTASIGSKLPRPLGPMEGAHKKNNSFEAMRTVEFNGPAVSMEKGAKAKRPVNSMSKASEGRITSDQSIRERGDVGSSLPRGNRAKAAVGAKTKATSQHGRGYTDKAPEGLRVLSDFISEQHEEHLLKMIDSLPWDTSMARRVQHYGWRYDYRARKVNSQSYLGALPNWAAELGQRLYDQGYVAELPDQVIVNEYIGSQSISKHIDCPSCFRGAIVTISLNESWEMIFTRSIITGVDEKYRVMLTRRSATILDGAARYDWKHEIPRKAKENGIVRGRRVSITLRKVKTLGIK